MLYCELCNTYYCDKDHHCLEKQEKKKNQLKNCPYCGAESGAQFVSFDVDALDGRKEHNVIGTRFACGTERKQSKFWGWDDKRSTYCYQREIRNLKSELGK